MLSVMKGSGSKTVDASGGRRSRGEDVSFSDEDRVL